MSLFQSKCKWLLVALALAVFYSGCKNEKLIQPGDTIVVAYKKAMQLYRNGKYDQAADAFETVINAGRGTDYAEFAHYYLAETYFKDEKYLLAADAYRRFITLYPQSSKRSKAQFKEALSYYKLSPRYRISQKYTHTAIEKLKLFMERYPDSEKVNEAAHYVTELREKLAHKLYHAADLYDRLDQYEAAVIYYGEIIEQYPETVWAERALAQQIETYLEYASKSIRWKKVDRYKKAVEGYEMYLQLFPQGPHRSEVENYVNAARDALARLDPVPEPDKEQEKVTKIR